MDRLPANLITGLSRISGRFSVFLAGALADRIGRPRTVMLSLAAAGTCAVLRGRLRGPWITPALIFLQSAFAASFYPAGFSLLSSVFPVPVRNVAVSMVLIFATLVGAGAVPLLIGFLADTVSFSFAFGAAGAATLAAAPREFESGVGKHQGFDAGARSSGTQHVSGHSAPSTRIALLDRPPCPVGSPILSSAKIPVQRYAHPDGAFAVDMP